MKHTFLKINSKQICFTRPKLGLDSYNIMEVWNTYLDNSSKFLAPEEKEAGDQI